MKIFIVYAHHEPKSFCHAMLEKSVAVLRELGHEVKVSDLYAMNFNPVASAEDFGARQNADYLTYALEQRYNYEHKTLAPDIIAEFEKMQWADLVIYHFPLYWFSMPAILKGWFDRVFLSGPCYGGKNFYEAGKMAGKKAMLTITAGSRQGFFENEQSLHGDWLTLLRPILRGTLYYVGFDVLPPFTAHFVPYSDAAARHKMLVDYENHLKKIEELKPLSFPKKADFG
ncbi:MAG: NAD(P)H-dependent oxidoreductase, partial [Hydrotalea sp.]|nr:NAD(P)H-dependent oxidoreductase [Hydrotalea sp.]